MPPQSVIASTPPHPWSSDQYLLPLLQDDPLLQLDFENTDGDGGGGASGGGGVSGGADCGTSAGASTSGSHSESVLKARQVTHFLWEVLEFYCCTG